MIGYDWYGTKRTCTGGCLWAELWLLAQALNSQSNLEKNEQSWAYYPHWLQTILQSYSYQKTLFWYKNRQINEQNRESRNKPTHPRSVNLWQRRQNIQWGKTVSSVSDSGKLGQLFAQQCYWNTLHSAYKMKLKMDYRPIDKTGNHKIPRRDYMQNILWHRLQQYFWICLLVQKKLKRKETNWTY